MKPDKYIAIIVILLTLSLPTYSQEIGRVATIPLKKGRENTPIKVDSMTIVPINLFVQDKPLTHNAPEIRLEMRIESRTTENNKFVLIGNYPNRSERGGVDFNYPMAVDRYTYALETDAKGEISLVIDSLNFGEEFYLMPNGKAIIGDFQLHLDYLFSAIILASPSNPGGNEVVFNFSLSDGISTENIYFGIVSYEYNGEILVDRWKNYRIFLLRYDDGLECVRLKVDKIPDTE